ncbi:XdhC family protein [Phaeobacter piscinae]|uniref:XdhC family protein n=1 Tax=Phaeobacter piscinae TaxID=1580596 RepID=UPI000693C45F|nr:XdhC family protein [Phaeobacter piscinae]UTS82631.1 Molybdenum cofactor insertion chaperone PaoD [Phaeobacter piscinae]
MLKHPAVGTIEPVRALASSAKPGVLAVITGIEGPSYRPLGATMAILGNGSLVGSLSSGCIEADIALHAAECLQKGQPASIVYGRGSPFADIQLPCGGGLEITLVPNPDQVVLQEVAERSARWQVCILTLDTTSGSLSIEDDGETRRNNAVVMIRFEPETFFYVFGKGPETVSFSGLVQSTGFPALVLSPDEETLMAVAETGCCTRHLTSASFPKDLVLDQFSAVVLFFHDHEWEPPILQRAVATEAFYIGAQGSHRAAAVRLSEMAALGASGSDLERIAGPIGLIPSVRDPRTLAVSVLAEILQKRLS